MLTPMTAQLASRSRRLFVRVSSVVDEAVGIRSYELVALDGGELPPFDAGSHIAVAVPGHGHRHYSLVNDPAERLRYVIAVQREEAGRGGSRALHALMRAGAMLRIGPPRNFFPLMPRAEHVLIGGGIGLTPMMAMLHQARSRGQAAHLWVITRSAERTPFSALLSVWESEGLVTRHYSDTQGLVDLKEIVGREGPDRHVYCCGPSGLIRGVVEATAHWLHGHVHFESFAAPQASDSDAAFEVRLRSTGLTLRVEADETLLAALRREGVPVDAACEVGSCGTCRVRYDHGTVLHRDSVLSPAQRAQWLITCVSRAGAGGITLDR
ncbi:MAG: oxidoreductase [Ramlibacter sp.]|nr:oxidoreductase [Ramlibacter sp.]